MPPSPHIPNALSGRVFRGSLAVDQGLLTRKQLRSSAWQDRRRLNALVAAGWTVIHVTAGDLTNLSSVITQLRAVIHAAA